jgi:hypothetical protein
VFRPTQAVAITTVDLWSPPDGEGLVGRRVSEVMDSAWRHELWERLAAHDPHASFMDHARHFVVPAEDDVIEVLAWQLLWRREDDTGARPEEAPASSIPG